MSAWAIRSQHLSYACGGGQKTQKQSTNQPNKQKQPPKILFLFYIQIQCLFFFTQNCDLSTILSLYIMQIM
jgi:hypothetical protein